MFPICIFVFPSKQYQNAGLSLKAKLSSSFTCVLQKAYFSIRISLQTRKCLQTYTTVNPLNIQQAEFSFFKLLANGLVSEILKMSCSWSFPLTEKISIYPYLFKQLSLAIKRIIPFRTLTKI
jgi:hypothetical protein